MLGYQTQLASTRDSNCMAPLMPDLDPPLAAGKLQELMNSSLILPPPKCIPKRTLYLRFLWQTHPWIPGHSRSPMHCMAWLQSSLQALSLTPLLFYNIYFLFLFSLTAHWYIMALLRCIISLSELQSHNQQLTNENVILKERLQQHDKIQQLIDMLQESHR